MCFLVLASNIAWNDWDLVCLVEHRRYWDVIWLGCFRKVMNPDVSWLHCEPNRIGENGVLGLITHRIHGAGIYMLLYANMTGVYWWDPWHTIYSSTMDPSWVMKQPACDNSDSQSWWSGLWLIAFLSAKWFPNSFRQGMGYSWLEFFSWTFSQGNRMGPRKDDVPSGS